LNLTINNSAILGVDDATPRKKDFVLDEQDGQRVKNTPQVSRTAAKVVFKDIVKAYRLTEPPTMRRVREDSHLPQVKARKKE